MFKCGIRLTLPSVIVEVKVEVEAAFGRGKFRNIRIHAKKRFILTNIVTNLSCPYLLLLVGMSEQKFSLTQPIAG